MPTYPCPQCCPVSKTKPHFGVWETCSRKNQISTKKSLVVWAFFLTLTIAQVKNKEEKKSQNQKKPRRWFWDDSPMTLRQLCDESEMTLGWLLRWLLDDSEITLKSFLEDSKMSDEFGMTLWRQGDDSEMTFRWLLHDSEMTLKSFLEDSQMTLGWLPNHSRKTLRWLYDESWMSLGCQI